MVVGVGELAEMEHCQEPLEDILWLLVMMVVGLSVVMRMLMIMSMLMGMNMLISVI
jgi:hypothetical protein